MNKTHKMKVPAMKKSLLSLLFCSGVLMMNNAFAWDAQTLAQINQADDLKIAPERANGKTGTPTWIWEVVVDGRLFVRPYNGKNSSWYQSAMAYKKGIIIAAGKTHTVEFAPVTDAALIQQVSAAYKSKYASSPYMPHMVQDKIADVTVEVIEKQ